MPEGPEVENVRLELLQLTSKQVKEIKLTPLAQKYPKYQNKQSFFDQFKGEKIQAIERFGKFLVWRFNTIKPVILNHLGMTGKWCFYTDDLPEKANHVKVIVLMKTPPNAVFDDTRNFGQYRVFHSFEDVKKYPPIRSLGVDGLASPFPIEEFLTRLVSRHYEQKSIAEVLLNQRLVAGVGNIYRAESLFHAKIHPLRTVSTLSVAERERLGLAIGKILQKALRDRGSTMDFQPYELPSGESGDAQGWHKVYRREGKECVVCGTEINRIVQKDRSIFFCKKCQE